MENIFFKEYFASLNSGSGFRNYFPSVLKGTGNLTILKGTPGSGKSSVMKKIASYAERNGYKPERIYCSSDPESLDGVIIRSLDTAVIDGTAPHTADPKYPVVSDVILNTADYSDEKKLSDHKEEIISLTESKSRHYGLGYKFLASRSAIRQIRHDIVSASILYDKMLAAVRRIIDKETKRRESRFICDQTILLRASASFGSSGICVKETFGDAVKIYKIDDKHDISPVFLSYVLSEVRSRSLLSAVSPDPFDPDMICALFIPELKILFCCCKYLPYTDAETVNINSDRFIEKDLFKERKTRIKFVSSCIKELENAALDEFKKAREDHLKIESLYISSMDFNGLDRETDALIEKIFR